METIETNKLSLHELAERQKWSLDQKIDHSIGVIEQFVNRVGGGEQHLRQLFRRQRQYGFVGPVPNNLS
jgi:hypothetical protein